MVEYITWEANPQEKGAGGCSPCWRRCGGRFRVGLVLGPRFTKGFREGGLKVENVRNLHVREVSLTRTRSLSVDPWSPAGRLFTTSSALALSDKSSIKVDLPVRRCGFEPVKSEMVCK